MKPRFFVIELNKKIFVFISVFIIIISSVLLFLYKNNNDKDLIIGGNIKTNQLVINNSIVVNAINLDDDFNRFRRPSQTSVYNNPYCFSDFQKFDENKPLITKHFEDSKDVILAYYAILQSASNMLGYSGGCGSIGYGNIPYPYAYELLTSSKQKEISFNNFVDSFKGIGYINLLKLIPLSNSSENIGNSIITEQLFMVEIEVITGFNANKEEDYDQGSQFVYYYGVIATKKENETWKVDNITYFPEAFLCAPEHSWFYLSDAVVEIVYGDNLKIINQIDNIEKKGDKIFIYASNNIDKYRFDFIRITNGYDILIQENIFKDNTWQEVDLLDDTWKEFKLINKIMF